MLPKPSSTPPDAMDAVVEACAPNQPTLAPIGVPATLALQPGARPVPGYADYVLVRKLGAGGFGEVWQARGPGGIDVALKFIRLEARGSALELRSLEVMKAIRHPNLAGLFGVWRTDQLVILAMELCDRSLQDRLDEVLQHNLPGIPVRELLGYMRGAAEGLDALHDKQVQHRDVKPGNLLLLQKGVKVADFGLAKTMAETVNSHTGALTLDYAAPEFFKGETTQQSDQYSLAATYVKLRTGHTLFEGSYHQVVYGHLSVPPDLSRLPATEQAVLARALAKEPEKRWRTCKTFVNELIKAHTAAPGKPTQPPKKEAMTRSKRGGKQTGALVELLAQPTMLPPSSESRHDLEQTKLRRPASPEQVRYFTPLLACVTAVLLGLGLLGAGITVYWFSSHSTSTKQPNSSGERLATENRGAKDRPAETNSEDMKPNDKKPDDKKPDDKKPDDKKPDDKKPDDKKPDDKTPNDRKPDDKKPDDKKPDPFPKTLVVDLGNGVTMDFVLIDPKTKPDGGKFLMGSPPDEKGRNPYEKDFDAEKQHPVELTKPYYLAKYPVTQAQYTRLVGDNPCYFRNGGGGKDALKDVPNQDTRQFPVDCVSWDQAEDFCTKLKPYSRQLPNVLRNLPNGRFALPTEAQWEYACRAGTKTPFSFGAVLNGKQANCNGFAPFGTDEKGPHKTRTTKVGEYGENQWGLCDMHGNVSQWCEDYYGPYEGLNREDPERTIKHSVEGRVLRGGSWAHPAVDCRAACRSWAAPDKRYYIITCGFRVAFRLD